MEQVEALYDFKSTQADDLPFRRGDILTIHEKVDDHWLKAELKGRVGFIPASYVKTKEPDLSTAPYYKGKIGRQESEKILLEQDRNGYYIQPEGAFLVRNSETDREKYSISVKHNNEVQHFKIIPENGKFKVWSTSFPSIPELVNYYRTNSLAKDNRRIIHLKDLVQGSGGAPGGRGGEPAVAEEWCVALYNFDSHDREELSFKKDDRIMVIDRSEPDWWKGQLNGREGLMPANYVRLLS